MVYMGSKNRIAKYLIPIITKYLTEDKWYVEPFCGGCNMIDKINHPKRIANDYNKYLIAMLKSLQNKKYMPLEISFEIFKEARENFNGNQHTMTNDMVGWVGLMAGFSGRFFDGGYAKSSKGRNYVKERINNIYKQISKLQNVEFHNGSYNELSIPCGSIIYCDPPYYGTKEYKVSVDFDHNAFWQWCREQTMRGSDVLVSEYNAPEDFVCVWEMQVTNSMNQKNTYKPIEKLFVHESIADKYLEQTLF